MYQVLLSFLQCTQSLYIFQVDQSSVDSFVDITLVSFFLSSSFLCLLEVEAATAVIYYKVYMKALNCLVEPTGLPGPNNWSTMPKFLVYQVPLNGLPPMKCYASSIFLSKIMEPQLLAVAIGVLPFPVSATLTFQLIANNNHK